MGYEVSINNDADKFLKKLEKSQKRDNERIIFFLHDVLSTAENPCTLPNAKKLQGYSDNRYRWRLGDYRIVGIVENGVYKIIQIIKISHRQSAYKKK